MIEVDLRLTRETGFRLDAQFEFPGRGVTALLGDSGMGKSTILRCIAGLETQVSGLVKVGEQVWLDSGVAINIPAHQRDIGVVFQGSALFPHLNVKQNLQYGYKRIAESKRRLSFDDVVTDLGLTPLLARRCGALSGGESQRVALGRALLTSPRLLLLDEPLAALDQGSRQEVLSCLEEFHQRWQIPILYVSHQIEEAVRLADWIVQIERGKVIASGAVQAVLSAQTHGEDALSVFDAEVDRFDTDYGLTLVNVAGQELCIPREGLAVAARLRVAIRARDVSLAREADKQSSILNIIPCRIEAIETSSNTPQVTVSLRFGGQPLLARITRKSAQLLELTTGDEVYAQVKSVAVL